MAREISLNFFKFSEHQDLSFLSGRKLKTEFIRISDLNKAGVPFKNNTAILKYDGPIPDHFNERIELLVKELGGEESIRSLCACYNAEQQYIRLVLPVLSDDTIESSYFSSETLKCLARLELGIEVSIR